jgi:polyisoprenoid-binding protein YceI
MAKWKIDPDHSVAAFAIRHLMLVSVRGQFSNVTGAITFDPKDPAASSVEASIEMASLTTGIRKRDDHLLSPDFFDAANHPTITFRSTGIEVKENSRGKVKGDLTIHGITRPVILDVEFFGPVKVPEDFGGETTMGFSARTAINRQDFNVKWNVPLEGGGIMVGDEVEITLDVEADLEE